MNERLRKARIRKSWSQEEAAEAAQVSLRTDQRWESGEAFPNFASRRFLREAFGTTDENLGLVPSIIHRANDNEQLLASTQPLSMNKDTLSSSDEIDMQQKRRDILRLLSVAGAFLIVPSSIDWKHLEGALSKPS